MKFGALTPTLATIERGLFGQADHEPAAHDLGGDEASPIEAGAALRAMIARRAAAASANPDAAGSEPAAGEFWWLQLDAGAGQAVAVLVRHGDADAVHGWLVASETAYAGDRDWVLQHDDVQEPLDPRLGMVQLWNAVTVARQRLVERAGRMTAKAFSELEQVSNAVGTPGSVGPAPGRVGLIETHGVAWVCGTPLGTPDPRRAYQELYARCAGTIALRSADTPGSSADEPSTEAASDGSRDGVVDIGARRTQRRAWASGDFWRGAGIAATLVLAVGIPYTRMLQRAGSGSEDQVVQNHQVVEMRGLGVQSRAVRFDVHFVGSATVAEVTALLQVSRMRIASGPGPDGAYVLSVDAANAAAAEKALDGSRLVLIWSSCPNNC